MNRPVAGPVPGISRPVWNTEPWRRHFSVLCDRGWCDNEFRDADIGAMVTALTGQARPVSKLPARSCPIPEQCQCQCHDAKGTP